MECRILICTGLAQDWWMTGGLLCRIGLHRWGRKLGYDQFSSSVIEWQQRCERCGEVRRWVETKKPR